MLSNLLVTQRKYSVKPHTSLFSPLPPFIPSSSLSLSPSYTLNNLCPPMKALALSSSARRPFDSYSLLASASAAADTTKSAPRMIFPVCFIFPLQAATP